jgi:hypothetical protein
MAEAGNKYWIGTNLRSVHTNCKKEVDRCLAQGRKPFDCVETAFNLTIYPANASVFAQAVRMAEKEVSEGARTKILNSLTDDNKAIFYYPLGSLL